jgi:hypothetical protein
MRQAFITAGVLVASVALAGAGCGGPEAAPSTVGTLTYGTPIAAGPKPDPARCQAIIRAEIGPAMKIRAALGGVAVDEAAARAAATDPAADLQTVGIPLTREELRGVKANGLALDENTAMGFWVTVGAPDRFGGMWFDGALRVAVVGGDPATLAIARCIEPAAVSYVWAGVSTAEGTALLDRIGRDMDRWKARGISINMIDYDETTGVVNVGVSAPNAQILTALQAEYGPLIRLVQQDPAQPL